MNINKLMKQAQQMQQQMAKVQEDLANKPIEGTAGGGMVKAIVNGRKKVISIEIEDSLMTPQDKEMMQDLVVAAINNALQNVEVKSNEEIKKTTEGMMPNIPGLDFSKMF